MQYCGDVSSTRLPNDLSRLAKNGDWALVQRIVSSKCFARAARLKEFLLFIAERSLTGRADEITEQRIGVEVFERPADYNPAEDSIVRAHARLLRRRLEEFYRDEGKFDSRIAVMPKGRYTLAFESVAVGPAAPSPEPIPTTGTGAVVPAAAAEPAGFGGRWLVPVVAVTCLAAGVGVGRLMTQPQQQPPARVRSHPLWRMLFPPGHNTLFVAADTGLVMYNNLASRTVSIQEYLSREYRKTGVKAPDAKTTILPELPTRRYTGVVDAGLLLRLTGLPEARRDSIQFRFARDLQVQELKDSTAIICGAVEANPWGELFRSRMNFHMDDDQTTKVFTVKNLKPLKGESAEYHNSRKDRFVYGHAAFLPNLSGTGRILIIEGTGSAGTEAVGDFLLNPQALDPFLQKIYRADGTLPDFEILIHAQYLDDGKVPQTDLIAYRAYR